MTGKWKGIFLAIIFIIGLALCGVGGVMIWDSYSETQEGYDRQETEEDLADQFLLDAASRYLENEDEETSDSDNGQEEPDQEEILDDAYLYQDGVTYTPDYALGTIECVLKVPTAQINRGVYTGTWDEISYDLDIWMVTAARPDYELGQTHYCIYGHNHTSQYLSFNNLSSVELGDTFTLTTDELIYTYEVTEIYAEWRETVTRTVVDNFDLPAENCYIITCGRNENRYKDLVVVGTMRDVDRIEDQAEELITEISQSQNSSKYDEIGREAVLSVLPDTAADALDQIPGNWLIVLLIGIPFLLLLACLIARIPSRKKRRNVKK